LNETRREEIARTRVLESNLSAGLARNNPEATRPDLIGVAGVAWGGWDGSGWLGREQTQRKRKEKESIASLTRVLEGKRFTEKISVNRFPKFS
jgi:hypothetical protein